MNSVERWSLLNKAKNPRGPALWKFNNSFLTEEYNSAKICTQSGSIPDLTPETDLHRINSL